MTHAALASMVIVECAYHFLLDDVTFSLLRREQIRIFYAPHLATWLAGHRESSAPTHLG